MQFQIHRQILQRILLEADRTTTHCPDSATIIENLARGLAICNESDHIQQVFLSLRELEAIQDYL